MDIRRCYAILELSERAGPDELKRSYRRLAFACHPDLHPHDPEAAEKFHRLNEAYVTLLEHLESSEDRGPASRAGRAAQSRSQPRSDESTRTSQGGAKRSGAASRKSGRGSAFRQEEILKNILKDPFAKQVFEEIFRTVKRGKTDVPSKADHERSRKGLCLSLGSKSVELDLSRLSPGRLKKWLHAQLDHEQTLYLPPSRLLPGTTLSITVRRGLRDGSESVKTTIPPDYTAGRPLRLKGLGRRLGPWAGDLYLRLLAK